MDNLKIIWQTIKSRWPGHDQFLHWWVLGTVFIIPLLIFNYGFNASIIRQLVLLVLVIIGLLIWASRMIFKKEPVLWQKSIFGWAALILLVAVLLSSLLAPDLLAVWGLRGGVGESNPLGWLAVLGLGLLITQIPIRPGRTKHLLITYLLSSTVLALFVIGWWILRQELVMPALTSFAAASLFFTVNAVVVAAFSIAMRGKAKLLWLAILLIHLAVVFAYDYDVSWYILAGGMLILSVAQLVWEKRLETVDFKVPFVLIVISLGLLFAPVQSLSNKLGFDASNLAGVSANVTYPRFFKYSSWPEIALGHGLGQGAEAFWQKAELVDMSQVRQLPPLGWGFGSILWEGGVILLAAWLAVLILALVAAGRYLKKSAGSNLHLALVLSLGLIGYLAILLILPFDWFGLFGLIIFMSLLAVTVSTERPVKIGGRQGERSFISFGAAVLAAFLILFVITAGRQIKSRLDFFDSISVQGRNGTTVDLRKLDRVIARELPIFGYRLGRVDFVVQALNERAASSAEIKEEEIKPWLDILVQDYDWLARAPISGQAAWQLAGRASAVAQATSRLPAAGSRTAATEWLTRIAANYERAIETLPRNVILFTEVARFYRLNFSSPPLQYLSRAQELVERALSIDNTFQPALMERAELLIMAGKTDEALESIKAVARDNPAASYSAGRLAFSAKKFEEAIKYYQQAISANPNHLQARYELVQAHMALSDFLAAGNELTELAKRAPADDLATQQLLKGLRELLK